MFQEAWEGTVSWVERHSSKLQGKPLPFGCKIRYLRSAEREVEKRKKMDPSLRDGIFMEYRLRTGGKWTGQCVVIDSEAYSQIPKGSGRSAYVHAVSEIYVPSSVGDGQDVHPTWPVAEGHLIEATASGDESAGETVPNVEDL